MSVDSMLQQQPWVADACAEHKVWSEDVAATMAARYGIFLTGRPVPTVPTGPTAGALVGGGAGASSGCNGGGAGASSRGGSGAVGVTDVPQSRLVTLSRCSDGTFPFEFVVYRRGLMITEVGGLASTMLSKGEMVTTVDGLCLDELGLDIVKAAFRIAGHSVVLTVWRGLPLEAIKEYGYVFPGTPATVAPVSPIAFPLAPSTAFGEPTEVSLEPTSVEWSQVATQFHATMDPSRFVVVEVACVKVSFSSLFCSSALPLSLWPPCFKVMSCVVLFAESHAGCSVQT